jgi:glutamine amidotransferase
VIAVVDYGVGNLRSVEKALIAVGAEVELTADQRTIQKAKKVVLPGVGAFGDGMAGLHECGLVDALKEAVEQGKPLLGICLGMQLLFDRSEEHGEHIGLGLLPGSVRRFPSTDRKVPHTGWNRILPAQEDPLLQDLPAQAYAYFNHSYYCQAICEDTIAYTEYGLHYSSIVRRGSLYGVQFHPEKSQHVGLIILKNFVEHTA